MLYQTNVRVRMLTGKHEFEAQPRTGSRCRTAARSGFVAGHTSPPVA